MAVIEFPKKTPVFNNAPCKVVFHGAPFKDDGGNEKSVKVAVTIENGDYQGVIDAVVELGGIWGQYESGGSFFLPWPCA